MSMVERRQGEYFLAVGLVNWRAICSRMNESLEACIGSISEDLRNFTNSSEASV
uniref:Uncharacterized protein n=1 Tax=Lepeophtheirus salmonis TaxID=72036 RepID=A0A0K2UX27_LEPSM